MYFKIWKTSRIASGPSALEQALKKCPWRSLSKQWTERIEWTSIASDLLTIVKNTDTASQKGYDEEKKICGIIGILQLIRKARHMQLL